MPEKEKKKPDLTPPPTLPGSDPPTRTLSGQDRHDTLIWVSRVSPVPWTITDSRLQPIVCLGQEAVATYRAVVAGSTRSEGPPRQWLSRREGYIIVGKHLI